MRPDEDSRGEDGKAQGEGEGADDAVRRQDLQTDQGDSHKGQSQEQRTS
jgi:hypothetical protein